MSHDSRGIRLGLMTVALSLALSPHGLCATYHVDCSAVVTDGTVLRTLAEVNALPLGHGDSLVFKRGTTCRGTLAPHGSGSASAPIRISAYGEGRLPKIVDGFADAAAIRLTDQEYWEIESLDVSGSTTYGILVESAHHTMHHIVLQDLVVHNVRGSLKQKESGLVVMHSTGTGGSFDDVVVDGVQAFDTTQWSGIFVSDAANVRIADSIAHDVQGDGIVVFSSQDATIAHSLAWHTGMQHQETIGTPNAIWTWRCKNCVVEDNEVFLADSPGVDGGAFDIDFGNRDNTVRRNYGHDTDGYCVSVFGAFGPTTNSVVADNLCRHNGLAPRLAQRQGAILLMTWQGGSIDGLVVKNNRVDWNPPGDTPTIRGGSDLQSKDVVISGNCIQSSGISFVDPELKYAGDHNRYSVTNTAPAALAAAKSRFLKLPETSSTIEVLPAAPGERAAGTWSLRANALSGGEGRAAARGTLVQLMSAALQFGHAGLRVMLVGDADVLELATDWQLPEAGVLLHTSAAEAQPSLRLVSPSGKVISEWTTAGSVELGSALHEHLGAPDFSFLPFEDVRATD